MEKNTVEQVRAHYDEHTSSYLEIFGNIFQAHRPYDTSKLLDYIGRSAGMNWKLKILDLGCGVGGPAIYFAKKWNLELTGVTISPIQHQEAQLKILNEGLENNVNILLGDYHQLDKLPIQNNYFDIVYFLESLCHSNNLESALRSAFQKVKTNGRIYIKDFYRRKSDNINEQKEIDKVVDNIDKYYRCNTYQLGDVITTLKNTGWQNISIDTFDFLEDTSIADHFGAIKKFDIFEGGKRFPILDWWQITAWKL